MEPQKSYKFTQFKNFKILRLHARNSEITCKFTGSIVPVNLDTIESVGGGSARCMMAEIFSEKK